MEAGAYLSIVPPILGDISVLSSPTSLDAVTRSFFAVHIRNANTRSAYAIALRSFLKDLEYQGITSVLQAQPIHIAGWVDSLSDYSAPTVKQRLAAVNMYFGWLVQAGLIAVNPAASIRGPRYSLAKGRTPVLSPGEARQLIQAIDATTTLGLRDRALIGVMLYSFARIGAVLKLQRGDVQVQSRRLWLQLREKGGKLHEMPCHHELESWLDEYLRAEFRDSAPERPLFPTLGRLTRQLTNEPLAPANAYQMVKKRARGAGIQTSICNHTFRATGITAFLTNGGTLEVASRLASHSSTRTTQLYDRRDDAITLAEVERIRF